MMGRLLLLYLIPTQKVNGSMGVLIDGSPKRKREWTLQSDGSSFAMSFCTNGLM